MKKIVEYILIVVFLSLIFFPGAYAFSVDFNDQTIGAFSSGSCVTYLSHGTGYACGVPTDLDDAGSSEIYTEYYYSFELNSSPAPMNLYLSTDNYSNSYSYEYFSLYTDYQYYQWRFEFFNTSHIYISKNSGYDDYVDLWGGSYGWKNIVIRIRSSSFTLYINGVIVIDEPLDIYISSNINDLYVDSGGADVAIDSFQFSTPPTVPTITCSALDLSAINWYDIPSLLSAILGWLYSAPACYLQSFFDYLYSYLYLLFSIPIGIIFGITTGITVVIQAMINILINIYNLFASISKMLTNTLGYLVDNSWMIIIMTGISIVVSLRVWHFVKGISIFGWKVG